jgi:hypothetical protein
MKQSDLGVAIANVEWIVESYALSSRLLLFGGSLGDCANKSRFHWDATGRNRIPSTQVLILLNHLEEPHPAVARVAS